MKKFSLDLTQTISLATSQNASKLSKKKLSLYRKKTAELLDSIYFEIIEKLGINQFMECGAHEASGSLQFLKITPNGKAIAIEANPITYKEKTIYAESDRLTVLNLGLSDKAGELDFFYPKNDKSAGLASFVKRAHIEYDEIKIPVNTISALANESFDKDQPLALWVDVEGLSHNVLKGAENTLQNCLVLKVEVESYELFEGQNLFSETDALLRTHGMTPILRDIEYEGQFNVIYINNSISDTLDEILISAIWKMSTLKVTTIDLMAYRVRRFLAKFI